MRIVQLSDTHVTHRGGVTEHNLRHVLAELASRLRPDFVVHTGDLVLGDPDSAADRDHAHALLHPHVDAVVPGNHDVGEPAPAWCDLTVTDARVAAFTGVWGADRFCVDLGPVAVLGIDSELLGSGLAREAEQWDWLAATGRRLRGRPTLLFLHKPLWPVATPPGGRPRGVDGASRDRVLAALADVPLAAVGSGHLHRHRQRRRGPTLEVWAPATGFLAGQPPGDLPDARRVLGVVVYDLDADGVLAVGHHPVPGLREIEVAAVAEADAMLRDIHARAGR